VSVVEPADARVPPEVIASGSSEVHPGQVIQVVVALVRSAGPDAVGGGGIHVVVIRVENAHGLFRHSARSRGPRAPHPPQRGLEVRRDRLEAVEDLLELRRLLPEVTVGSRRHRGDERERQEEREPKGPR